MSDLFAQINDVWAGSSSITTKTKPESIYMICRFLSLDPDGFLPAVDCNRMVGLPKWAQLPFLKNATPNKRAPRNTYPKKVLEGKKLTPKQVKARRNVCVRFNVSEFHGTQVLHLLLQQGVNIDSLTK